MIQKSKQFLLEVRAEFKKVSWPSRTETTALTLLVTFMVVLLTLYIGTWDFVFQRVISFLLGR